MVQTAGVSLLSLILITSFAYPQEAAKHRTGVPAEYAAKGEPADSGPSPTEVYRAYLNAVKKSDLAAARSCWSISGDDTCGALDAVVGMWVASHRFNVAISKAGLDGKQFGSWFAREDCTDEAIDRTLARLERSTFTVKGDTAQLKIRWDKGYEVVFDPADTRALEVVAKQLDMTVGEEDREILALRLTVAKGGHHLKQVKKPDKPQWNSCVTDKTPQGVERHWVWPLPGVSMDELALFLESRSRRPVVNMTNLTGYYSLELSDESVKLWPQETNETKALDQTGLEIRWERTKTRVLVVKDK